MRSSYIHRLCLGIIVAAALMLPSILSGADVEVVEPNAPVRNLPNRLADSSASLPVGASLTLVEPAPRNGYLHVADPNGRWQGWIHQSLVQTGAPAPPARPDSARVASDTPREAATAEPTRHLNLGRPTLLYDRQREGYAVAVDARTRIPLWVQYELRQSELSGPGDRDNSEFQADESLPQVARAELLDYRHSGLDRGHMAPAGDMKRSQEVMDESFLLSNIAPQVGSGFNRHIWRLLEEAIRDWVRERGQLTIITGPVFAPDGDNTVSYKVIGENQVAVPTHFFKIVVDSQGDEPVALAFLMPNRALFGREFAEFIVSINDIEAITGLDFLSSLPDDIEESLETAVAPTRMEYQAGAAIDDGTCGP